MKKFFKTSWYFALALTALFFLFAFVSQVSIFAAVHWLNTKDGQSWVQRNIEQATAGSSYAVSYGGIKYSAGALTIADINISDDAGLIAQVDRAAIYPNVSSFAAKQASASLKINHAILYRLPADDLKKTDASFLKPFVLPGIFFTSVALDDFLIERLDIKEEVFGRALALSPRLSANFSLAENIGLDLRGTIEQLSDSHASWLPHKVKIEAILNPKTLDLALPELSLKTELYDLHTQGTANLGQNPTVALTLSADINNLSALSDGQAGKAEISGKINGPVDNLTITLTGEADLDRLKEKDISKILLEVEARNVFEAPEGTLALQGFYKEIPFHLNSDFLYQKSALALSDMRLSGPDIAAKGNLTIEMKNYLVKGRVDIDAENLQRYASLIGQNISGQAQADVVLTYNEQALQAADVTLHIQNTRYESYFFENANIKTRLPDIKNPWPQTLDLSLRNASIADDIKLQTLAAGLEKSGSNYRLKIDGKGTFPQPFTIKGGAALSGLPQAHPEARNIDLVLRSKDSSLRMMGVIQQEGADVTLSTKDFSMSGLPVSLPETVRGISITGETHITGPLAQPQATANFSSNLVQVGKNGPGLELTIDASYSDKELRADLAGKGTGVKTLEGNFAFPMTFTLRPFVFDLQPELSGKGNVNFALDGETLSRALLPPEHAFSGNLVGKAELTGAITKPDINGSITLSNGSYIYLPRNIGIYDAALQAVISHTRVVVQNLSGHDGEDGTVKGSGQIDLQNQQNTRLKFQFSDFHLFKGDLVNGSVSADIALTGRDKTYMLEGDIEAGQFDIIIPERFQSDIPQLNIVTADAETAPQDALLQDIALDLDIHAPRRIFVRGWGLDAEFGGDLDLSGSLDAPLVNGTLDSVRGRYEEFGKRFDLSRANLRFQGSVPPSPYLDIEATTHTADITASVLLTGTVSQPEINFSSVPALPDSEILSRILFGRGMSKITPFQAVQLSQTLQRFSGHGSGFDPLGHLRSVTGIDDIRVDTDESGATSVGVGKYLTDKVYIEVEKGSSEASGTANIEIELTPSISLESEIGQGAQGGAGIFWSRDY